MADRPVNSLNGNALPVTQVTPPVKAPVPDAQAEAVTNYPAQSEPSEGWKGL